MNLGPKPGALGRLKFLLIGTPKSGSKTIHRALKCAGLRSIHLSGMAIQVQTDWLNGRDPMHSYRDIEAVTELVKFGGRACAPLQFDVSFLLELRERYDVGLLLNTRNIDDLVSSITRWRPGARKAWTDAELPFLPRGVGDKDRDLALGIEAHYQTMRATFGDDPLFRECDIASPDMPRVIEEMIGRPLPWWGVANRNTRNPKQ